MAVKKDNQNSGLRGAQKAKKDEFYTRLEDIEKELRHYRDHFKGKVVLCNCDDPRVSNFFHYFSYGFEHLGLKQLITTCYKNRARDLFSENQDETAISLIYNGDKNGNRVPDVEEIGVRPLDGDGDFRSEECIELLKTADIVVTNPPFSLFREYIGQLMAHRKKFLVIGNMNAVTYKEVFPLTANGQADCAAYAPRSPEALRAGGHRWRRCVRVDFGHLVVLTKPAASDPTPPGSTPAGWGPRFLDKKTEVQTVIEVPPALVRASPL